MSRLAVWIYGLRIGLLSRSRGALQFEYSQEALERGVGRPLLSVSMPTRSRPYRGEAPRAFFGGLLPEGEARRLIAYDFGIDEHDVLGLLAAIGRDCAGALVIIPEGEPLTGDGLPEPITDTQVADRLRNLRFAPLGVDQRVRVSLAGMQEKLLLSAISGGSWGLPVEGAPSTHIVKPAHPLLADSIANEAFCMNVARHLGIRAARVDIRRFDGIPALVIERYDRSPTDGRQPVLRVHQEDLGQAHALDPQRKYEERGGPSLRRCAQTIQLWARGSGELERLLDIVILNVLVGNADAHAKNLSLLHAVGGQVRLAPAYDVMATLHYPGVSTIPGMFVNGVQDISGIRRVDLIGEAASWGLSRDLAAARVGRVLADAGEAIRAAADETQPPEDLLRSLLERARLLAA